MTWSQSKREEVKHEVAALLRGEPEVRRVVVFGSFLSRSDPNDLDVAIFQDSNESYLPLAVKYRRLLRPVAAIIPLDVIPVRARIPGGQLVWEIERGEVVYER